MKSNKTLQITYTAVLLALLIVIQYITKSMGQFVTGSLVNLVLIAAVLLGGIYSGVIVAAVSPFLAFFLNIGPAFIQVVPVIAIGNLVLVVIYYLLLRNNQNTVKWLYTIGAAAILKFLALYIGIVKIALPLIPGLKQKQIALLTFTFSWPQLITAVIGGIIAALIIPIVAKSMKK